MWTLLNQSVSSRVVANVSFTVPRHVIATNASLCGFLIFSPTPLSQRADADQDEDARKGKEEETVTLRDSSSTVMFRVTLAQQRAAPTNRPQRRSLLHAATPAAAPFSPALSPSTLAPTPSHSLHSPFLHYPVIVRHIELDGVLDGQSINPLFATSLPPRERGLFFATRASSKASGSSTEETQHVYSPLLWLDDLSIPAKHSFRLPLAAPLVPAETETETETDTDASMEVSATPTLPALTEMSFELHFAPTSLLYFGMKRLVQSNMRVLRQLAGEEAIDELRCVGRTDYLPDELTN